MPLWVQSCGSNGTAARRLRRGCAGLVLPRCVRAVACGAALTAILVLRRRTSLDFIYFQF